MATIRENHGKSQRMLFSECGLYKKNLGSINVPKMAKKGSKFFCVFGAKIFGDFDQALIRTPPEGEL